MLNKNIDILKVRNRRKEEGEEIVFGEFVKSKKGYFTDLFFGVGSLKYLPAFVLVELFLLFDFFAISKGKGFHDEFFIVMLFFFGLFALCLVGRIIMGFWAWKFFKHVIVTNEGIWIMYYSTFWWSEAYDGKKHLFSPRWSLYSWGEIKKLTVYSDRISRAYKLKGIKITRWDGVEKVPFLPASDVESIMQYAATLIKPRKKKKKEDGKGKSNLPKSIRFFSWLEKTVSGERDEE